MKILEEIKQMDKRLFQGYIALFLFLVVLAGTLIFQPRIPIQVILVVLAIVIMIIGKAKLQDLIAGVILHPILAMTAGFIIAGAMELAGGFDVLLYLTTGLAELKVGGFPILGYIGVAILLANIPIIVPMPCGRILAAALVPGIYLYAGKLSEVLGVTETGDIFVKSTLLTAFIINAAASCGPSPLGGIGGIGEGNMGIAIGSSTRPQIMGIMIATGVAALVIAIVVRPLPVGW